MRLGRTPVHSPPRRQDREEEPVRKLYVVGTAAIVVALVGCGSDAKNDSASTATALAAKATPADPANTAYCAEFKRTADGFGDPGIDAIFKDNPNPTMAQWAAFLPAPIAKFHGWVDQINALKPTADLSDEQAAVVEKLSAMT